MNLLDKYNQKQLTQVSEGKIIPQFRAGDTLRVHLIVPRTEKSNKKVEGSVRIQIFEGLCITRKNNGIVSTFKVSKISSGMGVEKTLPVYSHIIEKI